MSCLFMGRKLLTLSEFREANRLHHLLVEISCRQLPKFENVLYQCGDVKIRLLPEKTL